MVTHSLAKDIANKWNPFAKQVIVRQWLRLFSQPINQWLDVSYSVTELFAVTVQNKLKWRLCRDGTENQIHTISHENGLEFSEYQNISQALSANIYFFHTYSCWERGLNEKTNGLIRQYLPKSKALNNVTQKKLNYIMDQLNHRPRKILGFKTLYELFFKKNTLLTVALHTWIYQYFTEWK